MRGADQGGDKREVPGDFKAYFAHLNTISLAGRIYKRYFSSRVLYMCARRFGPRVVEVGSGTGNGILGAFPQHVHGLEINPLAVEHCKSIGLSVQLIEENVSYPVADGAFDACVLDNVLEHIAHPRQTLNQCHRITRNGGGLIIVVPGKRGYLSDPDHKRFYDADNLRQIDQGWEIQNLFSIPFVFRSEKLSRLMRQYCLVAVYRKKDSETGLAPSGQGNTAAE